MADKPIRCARCGTYYTACYSIGGPETDPIRPVVCASCAHRPELWADPEQSFTYHPREAARIAAFNTDGAPGLGKPWRPTDPIWRDPLPLPDETENTDASNNNSPRPRPRSRGNRGRRGPRQDRQRASGASLVPTEPVTPISGGEIVVPGPSAGGGTGGDSALQALLRAIAGQ